MGSEQHELNPENVLERLFPMKSDEVTSLHNVLPAINLEVDHLFCFDCFCVFEKVLKTLRAMGCQ